MPRNLHSACCSCRACTGPAGTAQRWVTHRRQPRPNRLVLAALGLLAAAAIALLVL